MPIVFALRLSQALRAFDLFGGSDWLAIKGRSLRHHHEERIGLEKGGARGGGGGGER